MSSTTVVVGPDAEFEVSHPVGWTSLVEECLPSCVQGPGWRRGVSSSLVDMNRAWGFGDRKGAAYSLACALTMARRDHDATFSDVEALGAELERLIGDDDE